MYRTLRHGLCSYCQAPLIGTMAAQLPRQTRRFGQLHVTNLPQRLAMYQKPLRHTPFLRYQSTIPDAASNATTIRLTDAAISKIQSIRQSENNPRVALRVVVESGGCHGFQYKLDLEDLSDEILSKKERTEDDDVLIPPLDTSGTQSVLPYVVIDPMSLDLTKGSTLHYATELIGSSFRLENNPQASGPGCGCGTSFSLADNIL